jgi:hypothetical protein
LGNFFFSFFFFFQQGVAMALVIVRANMQSGSVRVDGPISIQSLIISACGAEPSPMPTHAMDTQAITGVGSQTKEKKIEKKFR